MTLAVTTKAFLMAQLAPLPPATSPRLDHNKTSAPMAPNPIQLQTGLSLLALMILYGSNHDH